MMVINMHAGWIGFLIGCIAGAVPGLFFYNKDWLGGYSSWQRRMLRLGHISFFGIGLINLFFALTASTMKIESKVQLCSTLLLVGAIAMPAVCYLSAWKPIFRHFFFIPALSVSIGIALFTWRLI
ncbi:MAG: hypothetical protein PHO37_00285 [Kiritimatiellae bacterium]|nr:hypothetical protein [Kiritimatiellia bacterium]